MPHPDDRDNYYRSVKNVIPAHPSRFMKRAQQPKERATQGTPTLDFGLRREHNQVYMGLPKDPVTGLRPDYDAHYAEWIAQQP